MRRLLVTIAAATIAIAALPRSALADGDDEGKTPSVTTDPAINVDVERFSIGNVAFHDDVWDAHGNRTRAYASGRSLGYGSPIVYGDSIDVHFAPLPTNYRWLDVSLNAAIFSGGRDLDHYDASNVLGVGSFDSLFALRFALGLDVYIPLDRAFFRLGAAAAWTSLSVGEAVAYVWTVQPRAAFDFPLTKYDRDFAITTELAVIGNVGEMESIGGSLGFQLCFY